MWELANQGYYLYTGQYYWTMSPFNFYEVTKYTSVFFMGDNGILINPVVNAKVGVRPVINLKANVKISSGNGTASNPYVIAD